ncbi:hypothetical protein T12_1227 [Trichinella patagoniensis]|uniref:Uncharacterized protein n=1 Tax=Trichinella patagoniensis TaxID=990121 RepID=A0A0V1A9X3_9BILA|nr:hypothetical protein T12_1227 [Trichinella patagoniensis]
MTGDLKGMSLVSFKQANALRTTANEIPTRCSQLPHCSLSQNDTEFPPRFPRIHGAQEIRYHGLCWS